MKTKSRRLIWRSGALVTIFGVFLYLFIRSWQGDNTPSTKKIIEALEACPNWHEALAKDRQNNSSGLASPLRLKNLISPNLKMQIMLTLEELARNDLKLLGEAIEEYAEEKEKTDPEGSVWRDKIELLNRYVFNVPTDDRWPLPYNSDGKLELSSDYSIIRSIFIGVEMNRVNEFYYFWRKYGRRPGTAAHGHVDTIPEGGIPTRGFRYLTEDERKRIFGSEEGN